MFFELFVLGVILLAAGYWATMFAMGRRDDVLHGKFVQEEPGVEPAPSVAAAAPVMPAPPARPAQTASRPSAESLQSLLAVIKQDLRDAAQM